MKEKISSLSTVWGEPPSSGSGGGSAGLVNEVLFQYNDFGQLVADYQEHQGGVNTSTTPAVRYGYAEGSQNTVRPTTLVYPNGRVLTNGYGPPGDTNDALSRITSLIDNDASSAHLADYSYLGLDTFVAVDYTQPDIKYTLVGTAGGNDPDTGDIYRGLDRFGRVKDCYWYNYGTSTDVDRIQYGYDRSGNRVYRRNTVAPAGAFDELYAYDQIDRLKTMDRGPLNEGRTAVSDVKFAQCWGLDATGNWRDFREDADGDGWDLIQGRSHNGVNEITDVHETLGESWITPHYDRAGNMTRIPQLSDPTHYFTCTYDAWNRLVKVQDGTNTVADYRYDGARRRTLKQTYTTGRLSETRHLYYTEPSKWQVIEDRLGTSTNPHRQFVWGPRYIDDLILRERDANGDGTVDERLYGLQDANWSVASVTGDNGSIRERYAYLAFGTANVLGPSFLTRGGSEVAWESMQAGYRWDVTTGLYAVRHRDLHPALGWIQRDPLLRLGSPDNLYAYCGLDPLGNTDPSGLLLKEVGHFVCTVLESPVTGCACFLIGILDTLPKLIPIIKLPPNVLIVLNALDCACDLIHVGQQACGGCPTVGSVVQGVVASLISCAIDITQAFTGIGGKPLTADRIREIWAEFAQGLAELLAFLLAEKALEDARLRSGWEDCKQLGNDIVGIVT